MKACRVRFEVEELLRNKDKVVRAAKVRGVSNEGGKTTPLRGPIQHCPPRRTAADIKKLLRK